MLKQIVVLCLLATLIGGGLAVASTAKPDTFDDLVGQYEVIRQTLLQDTLEGVASHARRIAELSSALSKDFSIEKAGVPSEKAAECQAVLPIVTRAAEKLAAAKDLEDAREAFGELSKPLVRYREMAGGDNSLVVYCPMVKKSWLQVEEEIGNPYYGQEMPRCGEVITK